ncbi:MAG TPA: DUF2905 domain-containing protein [Tepidiformaceae bacterium]|nr:DUF2905 domain-containing protein [Tepidiformaceae bacterium]
MDARSVGLTIAVLGCVAVVVGLIVMTGALSWVGRLPGDIRYKSDGVRIYIPITTMIVLSAALMLLSYVLRRFL